MAAQLKFYGGNGSSWVDIDTGGSGIGFFGAAGFGTSVAVGAWQENTYITNGDGSVQGPEITNIQWVHANSGSIDGGAPIALSGIPNSQGINIRFTYDSAVRVQNAKLYVYDRNNINRNASGVTTKIAEFIHPALVAGTPWGSGSTLWQTVNGSGSVFTMINVSPGISGLAPQGATTTAVRHDWYVGITASPDSIGAKTAYGLFFSLEYL